VSHAWEFDLAAVSTYSYLNYSQRGSNGFFGAFNQDNSVGTTQSLPYLPLPVFAGFPNYQSPTPGAYAPINGWLGGQVNDLVSGSNASKSSTSASFFPTLRANQAIKMGGVYRAGNVDTGTFPGATVSFATGEWLQFWTTLELPWGILSFGKRSFGFGTGLQYDSGDRTEEYIALVADYGPMQFGFGLYPWRDQAQYNAGFGIGNLGNAPRADLESPYWNRYDGNNVPMVNLFGFIDYVSGPLNIGIGTAYFSYEAGPEAMLASSDQLGGNWARFSQAPTSIRNSEGWIFAKYMNGRFFVNAEADWIYRTARWQRSNNGNFNQPRGFYPSPTNGAGSFFKPQYTESWRYMVEFGVMCGPMKVSFLQSRVPGPDRRHGVLIDRQPVLVDLYRPNDNRVIYSPDYGNASLMRPYSIIMSSDYGAGLGARNRGNDGYMVDASIFAGRADMALAANLNIFGSFFYAQRVSNGQGWGHIRPLISPIQNDLGGHAENVQVYYGDGLGNRTITTQSGVPGTVYDNASPAIPDNSLGWEIDLGIDWKLLEWATLSMYAGYWQPGKWFNFACIDRRVPSWNTPSSANNWGINPDRTIDPVVAFTSSMSVNF
jgi:hypothetical protein